MSRRPSGARTRPSDSQAARTLAGLVSKDDLANGLLFPPLPLLRDVSVEIAAAVARTAFAGGLSSASEPRDLKGFIREQVFEPVYRSYV